MNCVFDEWIGKWVIITTSRPILVGSQGDYLVGKLTEVNADGILVNTHGTMHAINRKYLIAVTCPANQDDFTIESMNAARTGS